VPFVAVMARATSPAKIALIEREGGRCHLIDDPAAEQGIDISPYLPVVERA
jgi:cysteine synthase